MNSRELSDQYIREISLRRDGVPSFESYPFNVPCVRHLDTLVLHPKVTYFVGENGTGKSTLLEAIAVAAGLNAEGGSRNFNFATYASHSPLHEYLRVIRGTRRPRDNYFLRAETFYNVATEVERLGVDGYGGQSLHAQSHGESFWSLLHHRLAGQGLYFFDEPEAALSPTRQMATLSIMHRLIQQQSQFIIATHSPILMAYPEATMYLLADDGITETSYRETDHYRVTRDFLNRTDAMLGELLSDE